MEPGPGWRDVFVPAIAVLVFAFVTPVVNLVRPRWTRFRVASHAAVDIAVIAIGIVSLVLGSWVVLAAGATATAEELGVMEAINTSSASRSRRRSS